MIYFEEWSEVSPTEKRICITYESELDGAAEACFCGGHCSDLEIIDQGGFVYLEMLCEGNQYIILKIGIGLEISS